MKRFILKIRLFLSTFIMKRNNQVQEKGFIYEFDDEEFKKLPIEEQAKEVQRSWNRHMRDG
jgi:hypothetical protein|tara:strand:+ start:709 stop:891 length:183 start_codon:yes stop_codon:yes gene_type:complete